MVNYPLYSAHKDCEYKNNHLCLKKQLLSLKTKHTKTKILQNFFIFAEIK